MANAAMNYMAGQDFAGKGTELMDKYIDSKGLKLYFQVDTQYVINKLKLLYVPFIHKEWSLRYSGPSNAPMTPRDDVNVPDLYIPCMALLTYVLLAGISLGQHSEFTPESLGGSLSSGLGWLAFETLIVSFVMYLVSVRTDMKTYDVLAYIGYKFVPVCTIMLFSIMFSGLYWIIYLATSASCAFFIVKTMSTKIQAKTANVTDSDYGNADAHAQKNSKTIYLTWAIAAIQPILIWILTYSFAG